MTMDETVAKYYDACVVADLEAKIARLESRVKELDEDCKLAYNDGFQDGLDAAIVGGSLV